MSSDSPQKTQLDSAALNALLSLPESDPEVVSEFLTYLDENKLTPVGRIHGHPVYRLDDYTMGSGCYLVDERFKAFEVATSSINFDIIGDFLIIKSSHEASENESFIVPLDVINVVIEKLDGSKLTPSELRMAAQLLCGMTIQDSAIADNLSVETKRSHTKSVMGKVGVARQVDVMRILLPELLLLTDVQKWDQGYQRLFNEYANSFLPDRTRCQRIIDSTGKSVRFVDFGPQRGRPVIMLHSMIFPDITEEDIDFAYTNDIRLIWPLRPGLLDTMSAPKSVELYSRETLEGIELVWEQLSGVPTPIIAMVSSAWHATEFAEKHPDKVTEINYAATCFSAGKYENNVVYFASSVAELCSRNTWLMTRTVDFFQKRVGEIGAFQRTITRIFNGSEPDIEVLTKEFDAPFYGKRLKMVVVDSPESIKHDYFNQVHFSWARVKNLKVPVTFTHGQLDSAHRIIDLKRLISSIGRFPLVQMEDSGHILQYGHLRSLLRSALALD